MNKNIFKTTLLAISVALISSSALAQRGGDDSQGQRRGPPPEAIEACSGSSEGASCQFSGRRGDVSGTCFIPSESQGELACKPSNHRESNSGGDRGNDRGSDRD